MAHLMGHIVEEGQSICLVAASWWSYWSNYAALTKEDVLRVPERLAFGLHKTEEYLDQAPADVPFVVGGVQAEGRGVTAASMDATKTSPERAMGGPAAVATGAGAGGNGNGNGHGHATREAQAAASLAGAGKERALPTMLAMRPHEIDNSSLQVKEVLRLRWRLVRLPAVEGHTVVTAQDLRLSHQMGSWRTSVHFLETCMDT